MSLLQEIFDWSNELPIWHGEAISRLLEKDKLSSDDLDDLLAIIKSEHNIPDPESRKARKPAINHASDNINNHDEIKLLAIKNVKNVNALAENQELPIAAEGLTVIYGSNGSGKSGYSRILKKACRARETEFILPNAYNDSESGDAEATFSIAVGDNPRECRWIDGSPAPAELSTVSIFDSKCALSYLEKEDDFSFVPRGLSILEKLVITCNDLKTRIEREQRQTNPSLPSVLQHMERTPAGEFISNLSAHSKIEILDRLAELSPAETTRQEEIRKSLNANNPTDKAKQYRLLAQRLSAAIRNLKPKELITSSGKISQLKLLSEDYYTAKGAAELAAKQFSEKEALLPGTGEEAWRELFDAAKKFAIESDPINQFPNLSEDSPCPLCQQPLAEGATRLKRFEEFIRGETETKAQQHRVALYAEYKLLSENDLSPVFDEALLAEIKAVDSALAVDIEAYESQLLEYRNITLEAIKQNQWNNLPTSPAAPSSRLGDLMKTLESQASTLEQSTNQKERIQLETQLRELDAKVQLKSHRESVVDAINKLKHHEKLKLCLSDLRPLMLTNKSKQLGNKYITEELSNALNREFRELGVSTLSIISRNKGSKGKILHWLELSTPKNISPSKVLSEGEQRAVALGAFLAEVGVNDTNHGIVFDDPMSSLDHKRRERVAKRLVKESKKRQVIIFTHDLYYAHLLQEESALAKIPAKILSIKQSPAGFGTIELSLPFEGKSTIQRIMDLQKEQKDIKQLFESGSLDDYRTHAFEIYRKLRDTWELAIEELLLQKTITRFKKSIQTGNLSRVSVEDTDIQAIDSGMTKCSRFTGHNRSLTGSIDIPDPDELLEDINALDVWRVEIKNRTKSIISRRNG